MTTREFLSRLSPESPGIGSVAITPSNSTILDPPIRSLRVTVAGDVCFVGVDGVEDTWTCTDFDLIPIAMKQVKATGTDATGLKGIL